MPHTTNGCNAMLNGVTITHASAHSAFPGNTGANELAGGAPAYARVAVTFGAAAARSRAQTAGGNFNIPAGTTVRWVGYWDAATGGNFQSYHPVGNQPAREFIVDIAADLIRCPAHGYANGDQIVFCGDTVPGGLVEGTVYFVVSSTTDTIQVAATSGGAAIDLTSQAGSACQLIKMIPESFGSQGTASATGASINLSL